MAYRVTLTHEVEGSVIISEPDGLAAGILSLDRHPEFHTLVKGFKTSLTSYGDNGQQNGFREWIKNVELVYGVDAVIEILLEDAEENSPFEEFYRGEIGIQTIQEYLAFDHGLEFTPVQVGFWRKFISRYDIQVDIQSALNLDGVAVTVYDPEVLNLPSQVIQKITEYAGHSGEELTLQDCDSASTGNVVLSGIQTIDGFPGYAGSPTLLKDQTDPKENGKWDQSSGAWTRSLDANTAPELQGAIVKIKYGTQADTVWKQYTDPLVIGVDDIVWSQYNFVSDVVLIFNGNFGFMPAQVPKTIRKDISISYTIPAEADGSLSSIVDVLEIDTDKGIINCSFDLDMVMSLLLSFTTPQSGQIDWEIKLWVQKNRETAILLDTYTETQIVSTTMDVHLPDIEFNLSGNTDLELFSGDTVRTYIQFVGDEIGFGGGTVDLNRVFGGIKESSVVFTFNSKFEETECQAFLQHDVAASILDRITDPDKFYSGLLGSPYTQARVYAESGSWWNNILFKILHARGYTLAEKQFFMSFKDFWEGANPMFNLSLGYETISGVDRIVIRTKAEVYDSSSMSVLLSGVQRIKRHYGDEYFNGIKTGNSKGKTEAISGIDDPQQQTRASILKNTGRLLTLLTNWISQGLTIEDARRTTRTKSADYKFDDDVAVVEVTRVGDEYTPRINEDFTATTNLLNEDTRYNKHHTPARFLLRWLDYISGGLQSYLGTVFRFTSGEGNYDMTSTMVDGSAPDDYEGVVLAENGNIEVGTTYLWIPEVFEIEHYLTMAQFKTIDANRNLSIGISQTQDGHVPFFIDKLELEKQSGQIKLIGKFKNKFNIQSVQQGGTIITGGKIFDATFDFSFE
jgi:hypothetical protein